MESRAKALGHPIHPMLVVFPLGLLATAVVFDILYLIFGNQNFPVAAYWMMAAGLVGGLLAAVFGLVDWLAIPAGTRARSVGLTHGAGNVVVTALFAISWFLRMDAAGHVPSTLALVLSFAGALLAGFTGWLGGELVYRLGVAVDRGAHLDAASSLSGEPAHDRRAAAPTLLPQTGLTHEEDPDVD